MGEIRCHYCEKGEIMAAVGIEIAELSASTLYLFREQSHPGRCILAYNGHVGDITDLPDERRRQFFDDLVRAARAIQKAYNPDKINYAAFGDKMPHLHFHLTPKYRDAFEWGDVFAMNPKRIELADAEGGEAAEKIRRVL
ncbi:MAG: HIT family protein [Planctomycetota bacterium]|jgi:diadenosine tetraphosphate (Ap4A) HIT family hydrolase|nr:HIT family protein [Planctomycetota bacterium]